MRVSGHIVDIHQKRIYDGEIGFSNGVIVSILEKKDVENQFIMPGFIDAHVHVESSMVIPSEFARMAVVHGTVATISDPHEIGNVMGVEGVDYMIENGRQVPFKFYFGAPSCVPATPFETAGAEINDRDVEKLLSRPEINYLAEMMNWPGVLKGEANVISRINAARRMNKIVDGHAPGLRGEQAKKYIETGISTDHECSTIGEALDKLDFGMKILIREGSAARNFDALVDLIDDHWKEIMFCSDDKHPDSLEAGHINLLVKRALDRNIDLFKVLSVACVNPVQHYKLDVGQLRMGDAADFIVVKDLKSFTVLKTFVNGELVAENGTTRISRRQNSRLNNFRTSHKRPSDFEVRATGTRIRVIQPFDGQLVTREVIADAKVNDGLVISDTEKDILKITVVNRYADAKPAVAFIKNFGLKHGAIASSVSHDSHNIIAVGVDDASICHAINQVIDSKGGVVAFDGATSMILPLPVAGIMSDDDGYEVSKKYQAIDRMAKQMGCKLGAPFMTLSFMALLVIPEIKLSDKGLFDASGFRFVELFIE